MFRIKCTVASGSRIASKKSHRFFNTHCLKHYGTSVYPGTLNLMLPELMSVMEHLPSNYTHIEWGKPDDGLRRMYPAAINDVRCWVYIVTIGRQKDMLEIVAPYSLRDKLSLEDGDSVTLSFGVDCTVVSGYGDAGRMFRTHWRDLCTHFQEQHGISLYPGTFNLLPYKTVELPQEYMLVNFARKQRRVDKAKVNDVQGWMFFPDKGMANPKDTVEIISEHCLREVLNVEDGDIVTLEVCS